MVPSPSGTSKKRVRRGAPCGFGTKGNRFLPLSFFPMVLGEGDGVFVVRVSSTIVTSDSPVNVFSGMVGRELYAIGDFLAMEGPFYIVAKVCGFFRFVVVAMFFYYSVGLGLVYVPGVFRFVRVFPAGCFKSDPCERGGLHAVVFPLVFQYRSATRRCRVGIEIRIRFETPYVGSTSVAGKDSGIL